MASNTTKYFENFNPATQELVSRVPDSTEEEFNEAVKIAKSTFKSWSNTPLMTR